MLAAPARLGALRPLVEDDANTLLLSSASSWEIAIKHALGRLALPESPDAYVPSRIRATGVTPVGVEHVHALGVARLPRHHRDPFDRLLVAQAQAFGVPLATADDKLSPYDVRTLGPDRA